MINLGSGYSHGDPFIQVNAKHIPNPLNGYLFRVDSHNLTASCAFGWAVYGISQTDGLPTKVLISGAGPDPAPFEVRQSLRQIERIQKAAIHAAKMRLHKEEGDRMDQQRAAQNASHWDRICKGFSSGCNFIYTGVARVMGVPVTEEPIRPVAKLKELPSHLRIQRKSIENAGCFQIVAQLPNEETVTVECDYT